MRRNYRFPVDPSFVYVGYFECAVIGLVIGVLSGILASVILKLRIRTSAVGIDALVGAVGCAVTVGVLWRLGIQYNFIVAVTIAILLPLLHQLFRLRRLGLGRS